MERVLGRLVDPARLVFGIRSWRSKRINNLGVGQFICFVGNCVLLKRCTGSIIQLTSNFASVNPLLGEEVLACENQAFSVQVAAMFEDQRVYAASNVGEEFAARYAHCA